MEHVGYHGLRCCFAVVVGVGDGGKGGRGEGKLGDAEGGREVDLLVCSGHEVAAVDALGGGDKIGAVDGGVALNDRLNVRRRLALVSTATACFGVGGGVSVVVGVESLESRSHGVVGIGRPGSRRRRSLLVPRRSVVLARREVLSRLLVVLLSARRRKGVFAVVTARRRRAGNGVAAVALVIVIACWRSGVATTDAGDVAVDGAALASEALVLRPVFTNGASRLAEVLEVGTACGETKVSRQ